MDTDTTLDPTSYEFLIDTESHAEPYVGLRAVLNDGSSVTLPMTEDTAQTVGRMLCAHSDYVAQRSPRDW